MDRRTALKAGAAGVTLAGVAVFLGTRVDDDETTGTATPTAAPTATPTPTPTDQPTTTPEPPARHADEFGTVVDVVEAGADPTGETPVGGVLERSAGDDTLLSVPEGTYLLDPVAFEGYRHLGISAARDERPTFVGAECPGRDPAASFNDVTDLLLEGVDFDFRRTGAGGVVRIDATGESVVRDVGVVGSCSRQVASVRVDAPAPDATVLVEGLRARNDRDPSLTGVFVGEDHAGEIAFRGCEVRGFSDNGLYASAPGLAGGGDGAVHVDGGRYVDNNVANVRLGSTGSTIRGATVRTETEGASAWGNPETVTVRGIRLRNRGGQRIEDCEVYVGAGDGNGFGGVVFHSDNAGAVIRNTRVTVDRDDVPAVYAFPPSSDYETSPVLEGVTLDGGANDGYIAEFVGRRGVELRNCTIKGTGAERDGVRFAYKGGCRLINCDIQVSGIPVVLRETSAEIRNTTVTTPTGTRTVDRDFESVNYAEVEP